jgi:preprotein translocase subunit SecA
MFLLNKIFKDPNKRYIESLGLTIEKINSLEKSFEKLTRDDFKNKTEKLKSKIKESNDKEKTLKEILPEAFALTREASKRVLGQRHYDVQLMGGIALHEGKVTEMRTGEGKTLSATLPVYLNALDGEGVHIITVNDYLARRDAVWMGQIYGFLGLSTSCINHQQSFLYDPDFSSEGDEVDQKRDDLGGFKIVQDFLRPCSRKEAYGADITYGTNNEFGFDYLKDNMAYNSSSKVQRNFNFALIDEVDSILIDEARTPLIISAPDTESSKMYSSISKIIPQLKSTDDYNVFEKEKTVTLTEKGIEKIEDILEIDNIYEEKGIKYLHHLEQALRAEAINPETGKPLFEKDHHYIVREGEVIIIDESTGRQMPGRRWSGGLHQAIEAKEGVFVQPESKTLASITFQNLFRMYNKLAGMTGTALTSAEEFDKVYKLEVVSIPTNKPMIRNDLQDQVYRTVSGKFKAIIKDVKERHIKGQPTLIGTTSIEKNELLSILLEKEGIPHRVLNAKNHEKEGEIIAQAGKYKSVTVATNMAGRGVDIVLGGNPQDPNEFKKIIDLGGLHVIGTERHEARRIDNQLRGRAGRQGDPGSSQFFLSLEDDLLRVFGGDKIKSLASLLKVPEDQAIETKILSNVIESAQGKIEGAHFDARKHLLDYDDVMNKQREIIYKKRDEIMVSFQNKNLKEKIVDIIERNDHTREDYEQKEKEIGFDQMREIEKTVSLRIIDSLWVEHLEEMEAIRESVRLRAYGQKDPLVEYKNEGHIAFRNLINSWEKGISEMIFKIKSVSFAPSAIEKGGAEIRNNNYTRSKRKIGRNDPCYCGAKKPDGTPVKYKHCHGRNN